jgi:hypothetical protein
MSARFNSTTRAALAVMTYAVSRIYPSSLFCASLSRSPSPRHRPHSLQLHRGVSGHRHSCTAAGSNNDMNEAQHALLNRNGFNGTIHWPVVLASCHSPAAYLLLMHHCHCYLTAATRTACVRNHNRNASELRLSLVYSTYIERLIPLLSHIYLEVRPPVTRGLPI